MAVFLLWMLRFVLMVWFIQHGNCAKLSYANCAEVEAEDQAVINKISHKFFCDCSDIGNYKLYLGCFQDNEIRTISNFEISKDESMTTDKCVNHCKENGQAYAATQFKWECRCGDADSDYAKYGQLPESKCNEKCEGNSDEMCGGFWVMSVYSLDDANCKGYQSCSKLLEAGFEVSGYYEIDPDGPGHGVTGFLVFCDMSVEPQGYKYIGCFIDTIDRAVPDHLLQGSLTIDVCATHCRNHGSRYFGLQVAVSCYCGGDGVLYGKHGEAPASECNRACSGDLTQTCGGDWRNSVFELLTSVPSLISRGKTVIDHELTQSSDLLEVKNKPGEVVIPITYKPSLKQISALLAASDTCQQHIQYDCQNSKIWDENGWPYVWWKSRQGKDMFNFGGVPTGSERCACSQQTIDNCSNKLGVEDGRIADSAITASTELDHNHDATQGRLNYIHPQTTGSDAWVAKKDDSSPWIQATFSELTWVSGVMLQGRSDHSKQWVETYKVQYTTDSQNWMKMKDETNQELVFTGNTDKTTIVTSMFPSRVLAKAVKIYPVTWQNEYVGLRFELLGCRPGCTTPGKKCNCDGSSSIWEKDEGFLTDREQLPITALRYGGNDKSKYTIGPLECNGTRPLPKRSCAELWEEGVRIDMDYEIDPDGPDGLGPPFTVFCKLNQAAPILRSCEELRLAGYTSDGYYDIDPDGPGNGELPFTVFCTISDTDARTRINHDSESKGRVQGYKDPGDFVLSPKYLAWSPEQMRNLIGVSERCFQNIKYDCYNSKMFTSNEATAAEAWWISGDNGKMVNWGGVPPGKFGCSCSQTDPKTCTDACNCDDDDDNSWKEDGGSLTDKDTLPVMKVHLANTETSSSSGYHTLGPLVCLGKNDTYPLYRTCAELSCAGYTRNGNYLLDSDGTNTGDDPYVAYCDMENNGVTVLTHNHPSTIDMKDTSAEKEVAVNYAASTNQLKALASLSGSCRQHLKFACNQFPIWDNGLKVAWNSVNGQKMNNWGGAPTKNYGCACMVNKECSTGKECNCDANDDSMRVDEGWITDKYVLPVTSLNANAAKISDSVGVVTLGSLECEGTDLPFPLRTCDEYMNAGFGSGWYRIDPDGLEGNLASFIVNCDKGATLIHHDSEERRLANGIDNTDYSQTVQRTVSYKATMEQIQALMAASQNCRQFIKYECHGSTIGDSHWESRDGNEMNNWGNVPTGETGCECGLDGSCDRPEKKCNCLLKSNDALLWRSDEGYLNDISKLPVSKLVIGDIDGVDELAYYTLGPLECFKKSSNIPVRESCHRMKQAGHTRDGYYDIDPDGSGTGVEPFAVYCDMADGSTLIGHNREEKTLVRDTNKADIDVEYLATVDQIRALIKISSHCQQQLSYDCHRSALFDTNFKHIAYWKHGSAEEKQYNFGGVDMGLVGCSCGFDRSSGCGNGHLCNCDKHGKWDSDGGVITNRNQSPIVFMRFGDASDNKEKGFYTLGKLQCNNKEFTSCSGLRKSGYLTDGYYTIHSNGSPELRFCKMTTQGICPVYRTGPDFIYQYRFPELPDHVTSFQFSVDAESDVYIVLSTQPAKQKGDNEGMYEIGIKPEGREQVQVQRCTPSCVMEKSGEVQNLFSDTGLTQFYVSFAAGVVKVGHVGKSEFISYTDSSPIAIKYVAFSSGFGKEAEWRFHEYLCNGFREYGKMKCSFQMKYTR